MRWMLDPEGGGPAAPRGLPPDAQDLEAAALAASCDSLWELSLLRSSPYPAVARAAAALASIPPDGNSHPLPPCATCVATSKNPKTSLTDVSSYTLTCPEMCEGASGARDRGTTGVSCAWRGWLSLRWGTEVAAGGGPAGNQGAPVFGSDGAKGPAEVVALFEKRQGSQNGVSTPVPGNTEDAVKERKKRLRELDTRIRQWMVAVRDTGDVPARQAECGEEAARIRKACRSLLE